jgi:DNA polymerase III subunit delta'
MVIREDFSEHAQSAYQRIRSAYLQDRLHHAYVISGAQKSSGYQVAQSVGALLVCSADQQGAPCGQCFGCKAFNASHHPDLIWISPNEKNRIPIESMRRLGERLSLRAQEALIKVVVIEGADTMQVPAQNALLKTLEEPPGATCIFLIVRRYRMLLSTIRSRCQRVHIRSASVEDAQRALLGHGYGADLANRLAYLVGDDFAEAEVLVEQGASQICDELKAVFQKSKIPEAIILKLAREWGSDLQKTDMAVALLRVWVRHAMAKSLGVDAGGDLDGLEMGSMSMSGLGRTAEQISLYSRDRAMNPNRVLALEGMLFSLQAARNGQ